MILLAVGCSGGSAPNGAQIEEPISLQKLNTGKGSAVVRSPEGPREPLWSVQWQSARIEYGGENQIGGTMRQVAGEMYEKGAVASTFTADEAEADKTSNQLVLTGNVTVTSKAYNATLTCEKLVWDGRKELIRALGNVRFKSRQYEAGVFDELLASPKINQIGTPDLFYKVNRSLGK